MSSAPRIATIALASTREGLFNQESRAARARKSPPERERLHFKATLAIRHQAPAAFIYFTSSFICRNQPAPGGRYPNGAACMLSSGIRGLDCSHHPAALPSSPWGGGAQYVARPSGIWSLIPPVNSGSLLSVAGTPPEGELLIRDPDRPSRTRGSIWTSQLVLDSGPPC